MEIYIHRCTHTVFLKELSWYMTVLNIFCVSTYQYLHNHFTKIIILSNKTRHFWFLNFTSCLGNPRKWKRWVSHPKQNPSFDRQIKLSCPYIDGSIICFHFWVWDKILLLLALFWFHLTFLHFKWLMFNN